MIEYLNEGVSASVLSIAAFVLVLRCDATQSARVTRIASTSKTGTAKTKCHRLGVLNSI